MATRGKANRELTADEKLRILEEARQLNTSVSEPGRREIYKLEK